MTNFQRMVVIPQDEYFNLSSSLQQVKQPLEQQFHKVEQQYHADANIQDPYRRLALQSTSLDEMKSLKELMRNSLIAATPKPYRNRAQALLHNVEPFLQYNTKGEIYTTGNDHIAGSRVEDLINYAVRDRRRQDIVPAGWSHFLNILREHNIPKSILNRYTLDELEGKTSSFIKEEAPTPISRKRSYIGDYAPLHPTAHRTRILAKRKAKTEAVDFLKNFKHE